MSIGRGIRRGRLTLHGWIGLRTPVDSTFSSSGPRTIQIIENVDIIQIFASVHLLLRVDHPRYLSAWRKVICQHYRIWEIVNWFVFWSWRTWRKKELFYAISVRESTRHLMGAWGGWLRARCSETGQRSQELHMPKFLYDQSTALNDSCFSTVCPTGPHASIQDLSCHTINSTSGCMCPMNMVSCMQNDSADCSE